jgi:hypothetical protein
MMDLARKKSGKKSGQPLIEGDPSVKEDAFTQVAGSSHERSIARLTGSDLSATLVVREFNGQVAPDSDWPPAVKIACLRFLSRAPARHQRMYL